MNTSEIRSGIETTQTKPGFRQRLEALRDVCRAGVRLQRQDGVWTREKVHTGAAGLRHRQEGQPGTCVLA